MARIRTVKPEIFTHDDLYKVEADAGLPIIRCFIGLWTQADREGRFKWKPERLKVAIAPYDNLDFSRVLHALWTGGFIVKYRAAGEEFGHIPSWSKNQVINNREAKSELPDPNDSTILQHDEHASVTREARDEHAGQGERKGKEGKGKEGDSHASGTGDLTNQAQMAIQLLNHVTGREFKGAKADLEKARARLREGFTLADMKLVFEHKVQEWGYSDMRKFLRPETLLGTKFDGYLQEAKAGDPVDELDQLKESLDAQIAAAGMAPAMKKPGVK